MRSSQSFELGSTKTENHDAKVRGTKPVEPKNPTWRKDRLAIGYGMNWYPNSCPSLNAHMLTLKWGHFL